MSNSREEGWLQLKVGEMGNWDRMYVTFENGIFQYSPVKPETTDSDLDLFDSGTKFLMDQVISLRTDVRVPTLICWEYSSTFPERSPSNYATLIDSQDQYGESTIQIATTEHMLYLRATSKEEVRCFHHHLTP